MNTPDLREMTEKDWATQVCALARTLGWRRYHTYRSKNSAAGWPDEALVRDRLILIELKTETGKLTAEQKEWLRALQLAGVEVYLARPRDFDDVAQILAVRHVNGDFPADTRGTEACRARDRLLANLNTAISP